MRFLRKNTAVIVAVGPFYDKTDGVTPETALTITNERITLVAETDDGNAPTLILDNIAGATSGTSNDLNYITGQDNGMMQMELQQSDVNRQGRLFLTITDAANHVPVFHVFQILPTQVYDSLFAGTDLLDVNVSKVNETSQTAGDLAALITTVDGVVDGTAAKIVGTLDTGTHKPQSGDAFARLGAPAGASVSADVAAVKSDSGAILVDTGTTLDGKLNTLDTKVDTVDANVDAILVDTSTTLDDKLDTLIAAGSTGGAGSIPVIVTVKKDSVAVDGAGVWVTTDVAGNTVVAGTLYTNMAGQVTFMLDAGTYYLWKQLAGVDFTNPETLVVA